MSRTASFILQLDNDDIDRLLSPIIEEEDFLHGKETSVHVRLRYFQKLGFPDTARAGRGKKAVHGIQSLLQLAIAFEMLSLGVSPKKAASTVTQHWGEMNRALRCGWRLKRNVGNMSCEDQSKQAGLIAVRPSGSDDEGALASYSLEYGQLREILPSTESYKAVILIDTFPFLLGLENALTKQLRIRDEDVEEAMNEYLVDRTQKGRRIPKGE